MQPSFTRPGAPARRLRTRRLPRRSTLAALLAAGLFGMPGAAVQAGATLYAFGAAAGDTAVPRCDDCSAALSFAGVGPAGSSLALPFFNSVHTGLFVNTNGTLSFGAGVPGYTGQPLPLSTTPLIAPYFADVDTRNALSGQVWYRSAQDAALLATLGQEVRGSYAGSVSFNPTFAQIVTWDRVGYYYALADKLNTFQAVVVSDGSHTYTLFKYPTGGINWARGQVSPIDSYATVGFDAGDSVNYFNYAGSRTATVLNLPTLSNTQPSSPGTLIFRLDNAAVAAVPGGSQAIYDLPSLTWAPAAGSTSWAVNAANWTSTGSTTAAWKNGASAVFGGAARAVTVGGTVVAQRVTVNTSGYSFASTVAGSSLQLDSLAVADVNTVVNFGGNLVVITHAGDAGLRRANAQSPFVQEGALARGQLVFTDTSVLAARDVGMVNGAAVQLKKSAQLQLYTAGATTRASTLGFDSTEGGTGGTLDLRGFATTLGAVRSTGTAAGRITNSGSAAAVLTVDADGGSTSFNGVVQNGTGVLALVKAGTSSWTLAGANTYTGGTTLAGGTLVLGSAGALGSAGTLQFTGGTLQHGAANASDYSARFSTAANQRWRVDTGGQTVTLATGLASSGGTLTKLGSGTLQLAAAASYTGATAVQGGTLVLQASTQSPSFSIASGATLDLRTAIATQTLQQDGSLLLGSNHLVVSQDYGNANFGTGNAFDRRANVSGSGQIRAAGSTQQVLTGAAVQGGTTAAPTIAFGNLRVGDSASASFSIQNVGSGGPVLRGAIQTTGITSAALSGSGVAAQNWGALAQGAATGPYVVTFAPTAAGALQGQALQVVNNFDNVAGQTLALTGAAYRLADAATLQPVQLAAQRVGGTQMQAVTLTNTAAADGFSERLNASIQGSGPVMAGGSVGLLAAGQSSTALQVGVDTSTAGIRSGQATVTLASDGAGTSGFGALALGTRQVAVTGKVYAPAVAQLATPVVDFGTVRVGDVVGTRGVSVANGATGALSDTLRAQISGGGAPFSTSGEAAAIAASQTDASSLQVGLDTASAGSFAGTAALAFTSRNPEMADLALPGATVQLRAQVNHLAVAALQQVGGDGSFTAGLNGFTLQFGAITQGSAARVAQLSLGHAGPGGFSDALAGSFDLSALVPGDAFGVAGFSAFGGLAAGQAINLTVQLDSTVLGSFDRVVVLNLRSTNASDPAGRALDPIALHLQGTVVAVPEPATYGLMLGGLALLLARVRRRATDRAAG